MTNMKKPVFSLLFLLCVTFSFAQAKEDPRYDAGMNLPFNEKAGDVNPQTGNITLGMTDVTLPGRAGLNFSFGRTWALNQSNVYDMYWNAAVKSNWLSSETVEKYNRLGAGWSTNLPFVQKLIYTSSGDTVLNLFFGGSVFQIERSGIDNNSSLGSNLSGYDLLDIRIYSGDRGRAISYHEYETERASLVSDLGIYEVADVASDRSLYVVILKDNSKFYFRDDGKLMCQYDRTRKNSIWYFYDDQSRLCLVVDSVDRKITFSYDDNGNLEQIQWDVQVGTKTGEDRFYINQTRSVQYTYESVVDETKYPGITALSNPTYISAYREPYALVSVTDPEGNVTRYDYQEGLIEFTYDEARLHSQNAYLLLKSIKSVYTEDGKFRSGRAFEYAPPQGRSYDMFSKDFYTGYMEYYRISRQYNLDRRAQMLNDTRYTYFQNGEANNNNCYSTVIEQVKHNDDGSERILVTATYNYSLETDANKLNLLYFIRTESTDGFLERRQFAYKQDRTKYLEQVLRNGNFIYEEEYQYDDRGNLTYYVDMAGLVVTRQYDETYSIPVSEAKTVTVDGVQKTYHAETVIDEVGQVIEQILYIERPNGNQEAVTVATIDYDVYGNPVTVTDANEVPIYTEYDALTHSLPVKTWQEVGIAAWSTEGGVHTNWETEPLQNVTRKVIIRKYTVFNTDGTVWMEIDNEGYAVEHYYNKIGIEMETVLPNEDDDTIFAKPLDAGAHDLITDFLADYLGYSNAPGSTFESYFAKRADNPGARMIIDYGKDIITTYADIDKAAETVKITQKQGNGLGLVETETEFGASGEDPAVKEMTYDDMGRMVALTDPDATDASVSTKVNGKTVERHDKTWLVKYDDLGRQIQVTYPRTQTGITDIKTITYNDEENSVTTIDPEGRTGYVRYDWNGNIVEAIAKGDSTTGPDEVQHYAYTYDESNRKISFTDAKGIVTKYRYNERDLLVEQNYGATGSDLMTYNDLGQLVKKTDRKGNEILFEYDEMGRNTVAEHSYRENPDDPNNTTMIFSYEVDIVYDNRGNAVRIDNANLIEHYIYDAAGRVTLLQRKLKDASIESELSNILGTDVFSFSYEYNDLGLVTQMTYPDGAVHEFSYDANWARVQNISEGQTLAEVQPFVTGFEYTASGVVTQLNYFNGTSQAWQFDNRKRIQNITINGPTGTIESMAYTLNGSGDILSINDNEYSYDGFDRIIGAKTFIPGMTDSMKLVEDHFGTRETGDPINGIDFDPLADIVPDGRVNGQDHMAASIQDNDSAYDIESFNYDKNGNRTRLVQNGDEFTYEYGVRNRLERIYKKAKEATVKTLFAEYFYDANGNTVQRKIYQSSGDVETILFEYDTMNRLVKTTEAGEVTAYAYDNAGNRFIKQGPDGTTVYLRHGQIAVAMDVEILTGDPDFQYKVNRYVLSGDLLAGRVTSAKKHDDINLEVKKSWYHLDHLNSTKCITDEDGVLEVNYVYRAFGEQLKRLDASGAETDDKAKYSYGGKELDDNTNLYYFNARFYDATIGRFINVDPIQDGTNWYVYCNNNPLSFKDPTGLDYIYPEVDGRFGNWQGEPGGLWTFYGPRRGYFGEYVDKVHISKFQHIRTVFSGTDADLINLLIAYRGLEVDDRKKEQANAIFANLLGALPTGPIPVNPISVFSFAKSVADYNKTEDDPIMRTLVFFKGFAYLGGELQINVNFYKDIGNLLPGNIPNQNTRFSINHIIDGKVTNTLTVDSDTFERWLTIANRDDIIFNPNNIVTGRGKYDNHNTFGNSNTDRLEYFDPE